MDTQDKTNNPTAKHDIDLGSFLYLTIKGFQRMGRSLVKGLVALWQIVLTVILFLKRKWLWLAVGIIAGAGWGVYKKLSEDANYQSTLTARFNFGSTRTLYNVADYLNGLIDDKQYAELAKLLSISPAEAENLVGFYVEPVKTEESLADLYKRRFMEVDRTVRVRTDSFWLHTIPYKEFKETLTPVDIPLQAITVTSKQAIRFSALQQPFLSLIAGNPVVLKKEAIAKQQQAEEETILVNSVKDLDSLRSAYDVRLRNTNCPPTSTNMSVLENVTTRSSSELEVYDKVLQFRDELRSFRSNISDNQAAVQLVSDFSALGKKKADGEVKHFIMDMLKGLAVMLLLLLFIEAWKALNKYEQKQSLKV